MSGGSDRLGSAEHGPHAPKELAEVTLRAAQGVGAHPERSRGAMLYLARFTGQYLAAADSFFWAEAKPGGEGRGIAKPADIGADLGKDDLRGGCADSGDVGEVALSRKHPNPPALKPPDTVIVDGATGTGAEIDPRAADEIGKSDAFPLPAWLLTQMVKADLRLSAPEDKVPNLGQPKYFTDVVVKAILPSSNKTRSRFCSFSGPPTPIILNTATRTARKS